MAKQLQLFCGKKSISRQIINVAIYATMQLPFVDPPINLFLTVFPVHHHQRQRLSYLIWNRLNRLTSDAEVYSSSHIQEGYLRASQLASCKLPHDKIYSILGLYSPLASNIIHPSYSQPVQKVYTQAVKYFAEGIESLNLPVYSQYSDSVSDLPS
jgi:hypothetical protein